MKLQNRRTFLKNSSAITLASALPYSFWPTVPKPKAAYKFTLSLDPGSIGIKADQRELVNLAQQYGFESVTAYPDFLASLGEKDLKQFLGEMKEKGIVWGTSNLPFDFRKDENTFKAGIKELPKHALVLQKAGVTRMGTWILSFDDNLTYMRNFKQHAARIREIAKIVGDQGMRFGLEYVGPKTSWTSKRFPFLHTMAETKELITEIGEPNVGFILDTYHWYNAGETADDILTLTNQDVVSCDLNDAPANVPQDQLMDLSRMLPSTTGVINVKSFLEALVKIGYDGPIRAEPFNRIVNGISQDNALRITAETMKKSFALVE